MIKSLIQEKLELLDAIKELLNDYTTANPLECDIVAEEIPGMEEAFQKHITTICLSDDNRILYRNEDEEKPNEAGIQMTLDALFNIYDELKCFYYPKKHPCPYCGSENNEYLGDEDTGYMVWECHDCKHLFEPDDIVREPLRHQIAHILIDTDEDNQTECRIAITKDFHGLEKTVIDRCYQIPGDGTLWFHIQNLDNSDEGYMNFDELDTYDIKTIAKSLLKD